MDLLADIAEDRAAVLCAGFVGNLVDRKKGYIVSAEKESSRSDHERAKRDLVVAGLHVGLDQYRADALLVILREWWAVETIAMFLQTEKVASATTVYEMIDKMYWRGSMA